MHGHSWLFPGGLMTVVVWSIPVIVAVTVLILLFSNESKPGGEKTAEPEQTGETGERDPS